MTLTQLRSFIAVARYNGFTAAARALKISQTTITSQIQALEEEHDIRLFERRGRRVEITPIGYEFLQIARQMISLEEDAAIILAEGSALRRGTLKIGAVSPFQVTKVIQDFNAQYPDIYLSMTLGNSEHVFRNLDNYICDVGVVALSNDDERYHVQHFASHPVIAFVHRDHRLARLEAIELADLAKEKLLMREPGSTTRHALEQGLSAIGAKPRTAMEIGSREALREAVRSGLGIGTVSQSEFVPDELLRPLPIIGSPISTHFYISCLRERRRSKIIAAFFEVLLRRSD